MIDVKALAEANCHCRNNHCEGCPFQNKEECEKRETMNAEIIAEFMDMIGMNPNKNDV